MFNGIPTTMEELEKKYRKNARRFIAGWTSPYGATYSCTKEELIPAAEGICNVFIINPYITSEDGTRMYAPDKALMAKGWRQVCPTTLST